MENNYEKDKKMNKRMFHYRAKVKEARKENSLQRAEVTKPIIYPETLSSKIYSKVKSLSPPSHDLMLISNLLNKNLRNK